MERRDTVHIFNFNLISIFMVNKFNVILIILHYTVYKNRFGILYIQ